MRGPDPRTPAPARSSLSAGPPTPAGAAGLDVASLLAVMHLGRDLAGETDPDEVLRRVLHGAVDLADAERGFIVRVHGERLEVAVAENLDRSEIDRPQFEVSRSLIREVMGTRRTRTIDARDIPVDHPTGVSLGALGVRTVTCVPIADGDDLMGVMYLDRRSTSAARPLPRGEILDLFASQAAAALRNARAHREAARALEAAEETIRRQRSESERRRGYHGITGHSDAMQAVYRRLDLIVPTQEPVLVLGETGTGKELVARLVHSRGPRAGREFVAVNCAGLAETLLESELFGFVRGAFTGADRDRPGLFEIAHRGTLLLDEVGDMSPRMQGDLLRVLQTGELRRIGGRETARVDVRVIAATHRNLEQLVERGEFRRDLYYRLNVLSVSLPPLRERAEDIPLLVEELMGGLAAGERPPEFSPGAMARLMAHGWPGNVRELENVLRRLSVLKLKRIEEKHLPAEIREAGRRPKKPGSLREAERQAVLEALRAAEGNKAEAARILGVDRTTLYAKLRRMKER